MKKGITGFTLMMTTTFTAIVWAGNGVERKSVFSWSDETHSIDALKKAKVEEALRQSCPGLLVGQSVENPVHIVSAEVAPKDSSSVVERFVIDTIPSYSRKARKRVRVQIESTSDDSTRVVSSDAPGMCSGK